MVLHLIFLAVVLLVIYVYLKIVYYEDYWKKKGVKLYRKNKILGPFWEYLTTDKAMFQILSDVYKIHSNEPAVAFGPFLQPALFVLNPENVESVLQSDFISFNHRGIEPFQGDVLSDNVLFQFGNKWKVVRQNMTPIFTSVKLKSMYYIMDRSAQDFINYLNKYPDKLKGNAFDTLTTFYAAAVGASVFGISSKSVFDNPFHEMARKVLEPNLISNIKFSLANTSSTLTRLLKIKVFAEYSDFFIGAMRKVIEQRKTENGKRHDFVDLCISLQKNATLKDRDTNYEVEPSVELLAAQAFFFYIAGVEPSATAAFGTLVELGRHPEHLKKVQDAIDKAFESHNGELTYDIVNGVEELDRALHEALRLYPPIGFLTRQCIRDTVLPVGNIHVRKGTKIFTPLYDVHHNSKYYPEPEMFNPDRALNANKEVYMPFGKGGRLCIGNRYAQIQVKTGLMYLLHNFDVKTLIGDGGIKFEKQQIQVRLANVDVEFLPRRFKV